METHTHTHTEGPLADRIARAGLTDPDLACLAEAGIDSCGETLACLADAGIDLRGETLWGLVAAGIDSCGETLACLADAGIDLRGETLWGLVAAGVDLTDATPAGLHREGIDLRGETLSELAAAGVDLGGLSRGDLRSATLADLTGTDLRGLEVPDLVALGVDLTSMMRADLPAAGIRPLPADVPVVPDLHERMADAVGADGEHLRMQRWHSGCGTVHCRAGWAVVLAGEAGRALERRYDTPSAATMIYLVSDPEYPLPDWYGDDADALASIRAAAV